MKTPNATMITTTAPTGTDSTGELVALVAFTDTDWFTTLSTQGAEDASLCKATIDGVVMATKLTTTRHKTITKVPAKRYSRRPVLAMERIHYQ